MTLRVYELDGTRFSDLSEFARHFSEVVLEEHRWRGNLNAFNDILRGGFGTPEEGFVLRIKNAAAARRALGGYEETGTGNTLFDTILEIIRAHGPGGDESEDNVHLELED